MLRRGLVGVSMLQPIDANVLAALHEAPQGTSLEDVAANVGLTMQELLDSMHRLALREPDPVA